MTEMRKSLKKKNQAGAQLDITHARYLKLTAWEAPSSQLDFNCIY